MLGPSTAVTSVVSPLVTSRMAAWIALASRASPAQVLDDR